MSKDDRRTDGKDGSPSDMRQIATSLNESAWHFDPFGLEKKKSRKSLGSVDFPLFSSIFSTSVGVPKRESYYYYHSEESG
jgi:hypothetical protein